MASKGLRSRSDHETKTRRTKAVEPSKEPRRPKTHWDHVLEEMVWLSKDFESERKWKLAQAKKVAIKASKCMFDQATKGEKKVKEEEQRIRKIALNISKEMKKFWTKIEKLVLYKHQLVLEERKKKALDKQLNFLLGQTERYSTMLAENLGDIHHPDGLASMDSKIKQECYLDEKADGIAKDIGDNQVYGVDIDRSEDESEDDEHTMEEDEALITEEERREELAALTNVIDFPLEEILQRDCEGKVSGEVTLEDGDSVLEGKDQIKGTDDQVNGFAHTNNESCGNTLRVDKDADYAADYEEKDDEATLSEEEFQAMNEKNDPSDEIKLLQQENEMSIEELLARYKKGAVSADGSDADSECTPSNSDCSLDHVEQHDAQQGSPRVSVGVVASEQKKHFEIENVNSQTETAVEIDDGSLQEQETENNIADAAAAARSAQPTGNTFSTTKVRTKLPFLLKHSLREYQHIGLDWLVTMYEKRLNGILADEMGLGKTIMTISLLAHLACEKGIWGPHLIVVPTSVMLNWETEFLKWCPAFKILTYFGSAKERKHKRQGWLKPNSFHICITTYRLVIQDSKVFKRKKWKYLILDEAHLIKNWKSQRWQTLLNFNSKRRILLTGTPLQNDLMELWSLMHFLMPHVFQSHQEFKDWFSNPITGMVEGQEKVNKDVLDRLHNVLRPFILRRLKRDVEKQLPQKHEHVIYCKLSKRQRNLYEDFIASSETQATLASANFFGMISVIMQLRKVCNHPDLFEGRPIISSFDMPGMDMQLSSSVCTIISADPFSKLNLRGVNLIFTEFEFDMVSWEPEEVESVSMSAGSLEVDILGKLQDVEHYDLISDQRRNHGTNIFQEIQKAIWEERLKQKRERLAAIRWWNKLRCKKKPIYGTNLRELVSVKHPVYHIHEQKNNPLCYLNFSSKLADAVLLPVERLHSVLDIVEGFMFAIPAARVPFPVCWCSKPDSPAFLHPSYKEECREVLSPLLSPIRPAIVRRQVYFPDRRLIQFDCGKLQELAVLLRRLKSEGHRALIFTQMTKMLDVLEAFINLYGYTYMRLDGSTQPEERQTLMQRFNTNPKYFLFILSTRSGGVGINLVGADTVIFYDSDWNPAMDQQAQDRCHRIGQTREVHIYRLISESSIEENILKKANQKRALDDLVIQGGSYNTEFFKKLDPMELFSGHQSLQRTTSKKDSSAADGGKEEFSNADVEAALKQAEDEADYMALKRVEQEEAVENQEFTEENMGRLEDDETFNEDEVKPDELKADESKRGTSVALMESATTQFDSPLDEDKVLSIAEKAEDIDMLADVKQIVAAAAASGQASSSFGNQLRPIDRYAMRYLDLWDPIIDKSEIEHIVNVEQEEWELDRIQQFKDELEAEIDEDEEPFLYEKWSTEHATVAYKEHVEALAQRQLLERLENEALEKMEADAENDEANKYEAVINTKYKPKKKSKKTKFKSLKKGSLASDMEERYNEPESYMEDMSGDSLSPDTIYPESPFSSIKKRKMDGIGEEMVTRKRLKKLKRAQECSSAADSDSLEKNHLEASFKCTEGVVEYGKSSRSKTSGRMSITAIPIKRLMIIKPEKPKKKVSIWSKDYIPSPDPWASSEDAVLCAVVHEYGTNWSLVSDVLFSMPTGGFYRGRCRHPLHCCERFRELISRHILGLVDSNNTEKATSYVCGKGTLKVTEDNVHALLKVVSELPDTELLLQKHFAAVLSSVWRAKCRSNKRLKVTASSRNGLYPNRKFASPSRGKLPEKMESIALRRISNKVAKFLRENCQKDQEDPQVLGSQPGVTSEIDLAEIILEFPDQLGESEFAFPSTVSLLICNPGSPKQANESDERKDHLKSSCSLAEQRLRVASEPFFGGQPRSWASSAFLTCESARSRPGSKSQTPWKHKTPGSTKFAKSKVPRTMEVEDSPSILRLSDSTLFSDVSSSDTIDYSCDHSDSFDMLQSDMFFPLEPLEYKDDETLISGLEDWESFGDIMEFG